MARVVQKDTTASTATLSNAFVTPQRCRVVADIVRGQSLESANRNLLLEKKKPAKVLLKLLRSAMANAQQKGTSDLQRLYVSELRVDEGPRIKRFMPRAQGRADQRITRTSHIFIRLSERSVKGAASAAPKRVSAGKKKVVKKSSATTTVAKKSTGVKK